MYISEKGGCGEGVGVGGEGEGGRTGQIFVLGVFV